MTPFERELEKPSDPLHNLVHAIAQAPDKNALLDIPGLLDLMREPEKTRETQTVVRLVKFNLFCFREGLLGSDLALLKKKKDELEAEVKKLGTNNPIAQAIKDEFNKTTAQRIVRSAQDSKEEYEDPSYWQMNIAEQKED